MPKSILTRPAATTAHPTNYSSNTLLVGWRNPLYKAYVLIGSVTRTVSDENEAFEFEYRKGVTAKPLFHPIPGFDDVNVIYKSRPLFPFLAGRLMSDSRPDRDHWLQSIGAPDESGPFEILAHSFGVRANDTYELFAAPVADKAGSTLTFDVLVHGTRYQAPQKDVLAEIASLSAGVPLTVTAEPDNEWERRAHAVQGPDGLRLGYVPAPVLDYIEEYCPITGSFTARVLRINPEELGPRVRLVMRLTYHTR